MFEGVLDDILAAKTATKICAFGAWIKSLPEADQDRLHELLIHPHVTADELVVVLRPSFETSTTSIRRHRRFLRQLPGTACGCQ